MQAHNARRSWLGVRWYNLCRRLVDRDYCFVSVAICANGGLSAMSEEKQEGKESLAAMWYKQTAETFDSDKWKEKNELSTSDQLVNFMLGADFLLRIILSVPWTLQLWYTQAQRAKRDSKRFWPQLPKSLLFYDPGARAQDILSAYHVHNMHFGASLEPVGGRVELVHAVLVPASQYDYADAILHQHGVAILSGAGSKRGYTMRQPRDYNDRRPQTKERRQPAKLGKTYR